MKPSKHESVRSKPVGKLRVRASVLRDDANRGVYFLEAGGARVRCSIGRCGMTHRKREGDGCSPVGSFAILAWRLRPATAIARRPTGSWRIIRKSDGWCDDPASWIYNREIRLPSRLGHETMWRSDQKYDVVAILDCNMRPRRIGRGSAIFFHLCSAAYEATAGCIAVTAPDMRKLTPKLSRSAFVQIG